MPRKTRKIQSNKTVLIVVEGTTELNYFSEMKAVERIPGITVIPKQAKFSSVASIFKTAFEEQKTKVYDVIWCVFDCDTISKTTPYEKMGKLKQQAERKNIHIADSLPAFEIWFLLHYVIPKKYYTDQESLIKELQIHLPEYKKSMHSLYSKLKTLHTTALKHSRKLEERNKHDEDSSASFCNVHKLFEEIEKLKK